MSIDFLEGLGLEENNDEFNPMNENVEIVEAVYEEGYEPQEIIEDEDSESQPEIPVFDDEDIEEEPTGYWVELDSEGYITGWSSSQSPDWVWLDVSLLPEGLDTNLFVYKLVIDGDKISLINDDSRIKDYLKPDPEQPSPEDSYETIEEELNRLRAENNSLTGRLMMTEEAVLLMLDERFG